MSHAFYNTKPRSDGSELLAAQVTQVLLDEVRLTPKPGLVDRRGMGSHSDMSLSLMERSAHALEPFFAEMVFVAKDAPVARALRQRLGAIGREAERAMLRTTSGVNTHKGAIWVLGLLVSAVSQLPGSGADAVASRAAEIARIPDAARPAPLSHGDIVRLRFERAGARHEAMAGFPHVTSVGLPELQRSREKGRPETACRVNALLAIMSSLDDTCVLFRGGEEGLALVQTGARKVLAAGGVGTSGGDDSLVELDLSLKARGLSPGGSADLLAATLFLDTLLRQEHAPLFQRKDQSNGVD